jgi:hypothetical protein
MMNMQDDSPVTPTLRRAASSLAALLCACGSTSFVSTWKAPDAAPVDMRGSRVAAVVMVMNEPARRAAEDKLAHEISTRGAQGVAMYKLAPSVDATNEDQARRVLEQQGVKGAVVLRPIQVEKELVVSPAAYGDPIYGGYWGGYYAHGWGNAWVDEAGVNTYVNTVVTVETLVYSLTQNKLLWGGQSKTTNPDNVEQLVGEVAEEAAKELEREGIIAQR